MAERTVLRESTSLITEKILYATKLFWQRASPDYSARNLIVVHYLVRIDSLAHVQVDS